MTAPQNPQSAQQYSAQQALISAALLVLVAQFAKLFVNPLLSATDWVGLLRLLYPEVAAAREKSAVLARTFYDTERALAHPDLPVLARELEPYKFEWFVQAMEPARSAMSAEQSRNAAIGQLASLAVREVENAGRRQIIKAVEEDKPLEDKLAEQPEYEVVRKGGKNKVVRVSNVKGWARVATGKETCAFCLALISLGPVYSSANKAGLKLPESEALQAITEGRDVSEVMNQWHKGCDCKVVPVFDLKNWVGREASQKAYRLWEKATERAAAALKADPGKKYYSFGDPEKKIPPGWYPTTLNREAMNQLRQMIADGDAAATDWAALRAA